MPGTEHESPRQEEGTDVLSNLFQILGSTMDRSYCRSFHHIFLVVTHKRRCRLFEGAMHHLPPTNYWHCESTGQ